MSTTYKLSRPLAAAIAVAALAAPSAGAMPLHEASEYDAGHASLATKLAEQRKQDLRSPDARDAAKYPKGTGGVSQLDMGRPLPPTWPKNPEPLHAVQSPSTDDDNIPWVTIGIGLAGAGLALGGAATLSRRTRLRIRRTRVAA